MSTTPIVHRARHTAVQQPSSSHDKRAAGPGHRVRNGLQFSKQVAVTAAVAVVTA
ncbi:hypothetical protein H7J87_03020 [Mycolicibacterium wolinskyi]|uniref:hypothetical protein n=1 Tax=Mycolicibacterium TaxID=1866885 RepID=UPI0013FDD008|nr:MULTISPECIES: hypothetical protein [Mycolicibacterium]MCV7284292.1 hypothetical protein [Mycolicibacterium wolinskyi]MCV7294128.1 hypothetical protein [Mycolicibacterium goodii]